MRPIHPNLPGWLLLALATVPSFSAAGQMGTSDRELVAAGSALHAQYCARCHGSEASGSSAPDIRGSIGTDVSRASAGMDQMPAVSLTPAEIVAIAAWLSSLAPEIAEIRLRHEADRHRSDHLQKD